MECSIYRMEQKVPSLPLRSIRDRVYIFFQIFCSKCALSPFVDSIPFVYFMVLRVYIWEIRSS